MESSNNELVCMDIDQIRSLHGYERQEALHVRNDWLKKQRKVDKKFIKDKSALMKAKRNSKFYLLTSKHVLTVYQGLYLCFSSWFNNSGEVKEDFTLHENNVVKK